MRLGLSLANKTLLATGGVLLFVVLGALFVPWLRMLALIDAGQLELSKVMASTWIRLGNEGVDPADPKSLTAQSTPPISRAGITARRLSLADAHLEGASDAFIRRAIQTFESDPSQVELLGSSFKGTTREYRYIQAERRPSPKGPVLVAVVLLERRSIEATRLFLLNAAFLLTAGSVVLVFALAAFYFMTHKIILWPVRSLRETAERVRQGNLSIRADIHTDDEFEELADTFNHMLTDMQHAQDQLRGINAALDLKLDELTRANSALYETAKLKGEFLANVSHELRTPLNSIIGFAELLLEISRAEAANGNNSPQVLKRIRYNENIVNAGRNLLAMINTLLEMAKIEAGKAELHIDRMNIKEACEAVLALIYPLADKKGIATRLEASDDLPPIRTDTKKFQQIIFNFLSNAVKFTEPAERSGRIPEVILRAERLVGLAPGSDGAPSEDRIRVSVIDNGPGIPADEQPRVFEKFHQLDRGHTREHTGTGLGLAICKELASLLHAEIQLVSEVGRGSMFSLILPLDLNAPDLAQTHLESRFRGALAGGRELAER
jgi:signal transduction histidine kinase